MNGEELADYENLRILLTTSAVKPAKRRGRPLEIEDAELIRRFDEFRFILEETWARIGWQLKHAKTSHEVQSYFAALVEFPSSRLDLFRMDIGEPDSSPTVSQLRQIREQLQNVRQSAGKAEKKLAEASRLAAVANLVDSGNYGAVARLKVQRAANSAVSNFEEAKTARDALDGPLLHLSEELRNQEACFAQSELVCFISSQRRRCTPDHLAQAMAGIPYLTARASAERFAKLELKHTRGFTYRMFLLIQSALAHPPRTAPEAADLIRQSREIATGENIGAANELGENWYFLLEALRSAYTQPPKNNGSFPYFVFAEYQRRYLCQSAADVLLAKEAK